MSTVFRKFVQQLSTQTGWLISIACFLVYFSNQQTLASGDTVPNSILALNWLLNGSLDLDNFRNSYFYTSGQVPYFFTEAKNGHLTSTYPIGPAIISFPVYFLFFVLVKIFTGSGIDITNVVFEEQRRLLEKVAATIIASLSVFIFYSLTRLKFSRTAALMSTFIYAFSTQTWVISSQALWQHGSTNLLVLSIILCLFKANRLNGNIKKILILNAGILCGLLLGVRPTNIFFVIAIALYSVFIYRQLIILLLIGFSSIFISLGWNLYYYGTLAGRYSVMGGGYVFTANQFLEGLLGLLLSPSRGFFVFMPIMIFAVLGIAKLLKLRAYRDEKLIICLLISCIALITQYCFFSVWWAGHCYGPRFLTDVVPIFCFCLNYKIAHQLQNSQQARKALFVKGLLVFILIVFSTFAQVVGAFGATTWDAVPLNIDIRSEQIQSRERLWNVRDTQIERHFQTLITRIKKPQHQSNYLQNLSGRFLQIRDAENRPIMSPISVQPGAKILLRARVQNTGQAQWWGYETGATTKGETRIRVLLIDSVHHQRISEQRLYVSGQPRSQEYANALGVIEFPIHPGQYILQFELVAEGIGTFSRNEPGAVAELEASVA